MEWNSIVEPHDCNDVIKINLINQNLITLPDWILKCNNLFKLDCSSNRLTQISNALPDSLKIFYCNNNQITHIPNTLPSSLISFDCNYNQITQMPDNLPSSLESFYCRSNQITQIPDTLPNSLRNFFCYNNQLKELSLSIIQLQNLEYFLYDNSIYKPLLVEYFLDNLNNKQIKKYCYNLMWKVRMEF